LASTLREKGRQINPETYVVLHLGVKSREPRQTNVKITVADWIRRLELIAHPEGGYYREIYRSALVIPREGLPPEFSGPRAVSTAIYFLLQGKEFSAFHRLRSDETWHFYAGGPLAVFVIDENGTRTDLLLGADPTRGQRFQATVQSGCWFASQLMEEDSFALVGCTVAPGFDFADFKLARRADLTREYPQHRELIQSLTRA
jgi:predicted cupin superfamily sugar epimerase